MSQKEKQPGGQKSEETQNAPKPLSETIADAHASGDGALERGKDTLIASDDGNADGEKETSGEAAY